MDRAKTAKIDANIALKEAYTEVDLNEKTVKEAQAEKMEIALKSANLRLRKVHLKQDLVSLRSQVIEEVIMLFKIGEVNHMECLLLCESLLLQQDRLNALEQSEQEILLRLEIVELKRAYEKADKNYSKTDAEFEKKIQKTDLEQLKNFQFSEKKMEQIFYKKKMKEICKKLEMMHFFQLKIQLKN